MLRLKPRVSDDDFVQPITDGSNAVVDTIVPVETISGMLEEFDKPAIEMRDFFKTNVVGNVAATHLSAPLAISNVVMALMLKATSPDGIDASTSTRLLSDAAVTDIFTRAPDHWAVVLEKVDMLKPRQTEAGLVVGDHWCHLCGFNVTSTDILFVREQLCFHVLSHDGAMNFAAKDGTTATYLHRNVLAFARAAAEAIARRLVHGEHDESMCFLSTMEVAGKTLRDVFACWVDEAVRCNDFILNNDPTDFTALKAKTAQVLTKAPSKEIEKHLAAVIPLAHKVTLPPQLDRCPAHRARFVAEIAELLDTINAPAIESLALLGVTHERKAFQSVASYIGRT